MVTWAKPTPMLRSTVESVRSRCQRETGSLSARCARTAEATPRLPSAFSKSIGLTLCGIVDEPTWAHVCICIHSVYVYMQMHVHVVEEPTWAHVCICI